MLFRIKRSGLRRKERRQRTASNSVYASLHTECQVSTFARGFTNRHRRCSLSYAISYAIELITALRLFWKIDAGKVDVEAACSGGGRDPNPPVIRSLAREMLLYVLAWKKGDEKASFLHFRGAYRYDSSIGHHAFVGTSGIRCIILGLGGPFVRRSLHFPTLDAHYLC